MKTKLKLLLALLALQGVLMAPLTHAADRPISPTYKLEFDIDKITPRVIDAYHGEKLELQFYFTKELGGWDPTSMYHWSFYWQEVGMGDTYWEKPVSDIAGDSIRIYFLPSMDTGAKVYNCFVGAPGQNYRAAFQIRMRPSPGAEPSVLPLPVKTLDFAKVQVENAPYYTKEEIDSMLEDFEPSSGSSGTGLTEEQSEKLGKIDSLENSVFQVEDRVSKVEELKGGIEILSEQANEAIIAVNSIALYMNGNTNAWFAGTNYVTNAEQLANRRKFKIDEDLMDLTTVPCSFALWELRDGEKQVVWDQRDWTAWYYDFREEQLKAGLKTSLDEVNAAIDSKAPAAWGLRTPSKGLVNPNPDTLWVDTKSVTLSPGMAWETVIETEGCAYWTIVADNIEIGGTSSGDDSGTLEIKDYEGKSVMKISKTASKMVPLVKGDFETIDVNVDGYVGFMLRTNVQPIGEFCEIVNGVYVEDTSDDCPADVIYTPFGDDKYLVYFKAKDRYAMFMFAKFKVEKQGETTIEFGAPQTINGGIIYNGVKIAPEVVPGMAVGTTVTWKVVE